MTSPDIDNVSLLSGLTLGTVGGVVGRILAVTRMLGFTFAK